MLKFSHTHQKASNPLTKTICVTLFIQQSTVQAWGFRAGVVNLHMKNAEGAEFSNMCEHYEQICRQGIIKNLHVYI